MNPNGDKEFLKDLEAMTEEAEKLSNDMAEKVLEAQDTREPDPWDPPTPLRYQVVESGPLTPKQKKARAKAKRARKSRQKNRKRK